MSSSSSSPVPSDIEISRSARLRPLVKLATEAGLDEAHVLPFGRDKAKVHLDALAALADRPDGKYIDVTAITPTPLGEGKTTTSVGLTQGLGRLGHKACLCIRQPSMGPTFGIKGGAAGGGYSQVVPMEEFNLHLTGDNHAVAVATNLLAAAVDARIKHEAHAEERAWSATGLKRLDIDPDSVTVRRVVDVNDAALRQIQIGLGGNGSDGPARQTGFDIAVASEVMAVLALADGLADMRRRLGRMIVALDRKGRPVTAEDVGCAGAMAVLMKDAIHPNLMQTLEGQLAFVHAGPFANIAHGNSSIVADRLALKLGDYVVTESGFGAEIGLEKFCDIKCRASGLAPDCVVLVATARALKVHGGGPRIVPGRALPDAYRREDLPLLEAGCANLRRHIAIARRFGVPVVVAVNRFPSDSHAELELICRQAVSAGAVEAVIADHWARGGAGAEALAAAVVAACGQPADFRPLYDPAMGIREKIHTIATEMYLAGDVSYSPTAERQMATWEQAGLADLPVCMAKTHLSLSHDPKLRGVPSGYTLPIREVRVSAGAGFLYPLCGQMRTLPGLPSRPSFIDVDIDESGQVIGMF